jgi:hypothetical protein
MTTTTQPSQHIIPPSLAWLTVFVPALAYFIGSRFTLTGELGIPVVSSLITTMNAQHEPFVLQSIFYTAQVMLVQSNFTDIVSTTWMHDADLGRGFLLLSSSTNAGRVWRWERGGGPIPIKKSLFLEQSGCRSKQNCQIGSGAIAIDFREKETSLEGTLLVAEWGENRVVRLEVSGARTPLLMEVPDVCHANKKNRINQPTSMVMTPFGDLIVVDHSPECAKSVIWRLERAMQVQPLASSWESRMAHKWTKVHHDHSIAILLMRERIGGIALDALWEGLYAIVKDNDDDKVQLVSVPILLDNEEGKSQQETQNLLDLSEFSATPGPLVMDKNKHLYVGVDDGVLIVSSAPHKILGHLQLPERPVSLTIGDDGFLYISSTANLYRVRVKNGPMTVPTNLLKTR